MMYHVLVTRPAGRSDALCHDIQALGHRAYAIPTLAIRALDLVDVESSDYFIFLSVNAVLHFPDVNLLSGAQVFAIGRSTCQALRERGVEVAAVPDRFCSEGLLELPQLNNVSGKVATIVSGKGGLSILSDGLRERGAKCHKLAVYERYMPDNQDVLVELFERVAVTHVMLSSCEGVVNFVALMQGRLEQLQAVTLIVISQRVAEQVHKLGLKASVIVAKEASDRGLCDALSGIQLQPRHPTA